MHIPDNIHECKLCVSCLEFKVKRKTDKYSGNGKNRIYVDQNGKPWHGKYCCACNSKRVSKKQQAEYKAKSEIVKLTKRRCNLCNKRMPASRYFNCEECIPVLPNNPQYDNVIYF